MKPKTGYIVKILTSTDPYVIEYEGLTAVIESVPVAPQRMSNSPSGFNIGDAMYMVTMPDGHTRAVVRNEFKIL